MWEEWNAFWTDERAIFESTCPVPGHDMDAERSEANICSALESDERGGREPPTTQSRQSDGREREKRKLMTAN